MSSHRREDTIAGTGTPDGPPVSRTGKAVSLVLALVAPMRMAWIVFTVGENNLSNDYVGRAPIVVALLEGHYPLARLFSDTWIWGGHSWLGLLPIYWTEARWFAWDLRVELGLGLCLTALKVALVWCMASAFTTSAARWAILPVLTTLAFSASNVTSFTFGESVLQMQLAQVALAAGVLAATRLADRPGLRVTLLAGCGLLASWSWGGGVLAWPIFAVALFAAGERSVRRWAVLPAVAALALSQYVWFLLVAPNPSVVKSPGLRGLLGVLGLLGRPFANGTGLDFGPRRSAFVFGAAGLVLAAASVWSARHAMRQRIAAFAFLAWGLLLAFQIGFFREGVTPWYIAPMTVFWLALAALLAAAPRPIAVAGFATIVSGLVYSNRTWEDKSFYLPSRAPASAACLREWRTAPPGCHARVFQWGENGYRKDELAILGELLERHGLSVFGPRRTYLLQGDVAVGRVGIDPSSAAAFLSRDDRTPGDPDDFHRLDLVLGPDAAVTWRVDLPPNLKSARFVTRVSASRDDPMLARGARVEVVNGAGEPVDARALVPAGGRESLSLDLEAFAGKTVTLKLTTEEAEGGKPLVLEAPKILLELDGPGTAPKP